MSAYSQPLPQGAHLYLLTIQRWGDVTNVYCMATSPSDAFARYIDRLTRRHESTAGIELVHGELANPHIHPA